LLLDLVGNKLMSLYYRHQKATKFVLINQEIAWLSLVNSYEQIDVLYQCQKATRLVLINCTALLHTNLSIKGIW